MRWQKWLLPAALVVLWERPVSPQELERVARTQELVPPYGQRNYSVVFFQGQRALIIVSGDQQSYLGLYVYDEEGNCVAQDDLGGQGSWDDLAVAWYPLRTGVYRVEVRNFGPRPNVFQIALRANPPKQKPGRD